MNETQERVDAVTPHGGAYSIIYYLDDDGILVTKDLATRCEIVEFDSRDNIIWRTYGVIRANR